MGSIQNPVKHLRWSAHSHYVYIRHVKSMNIPVKNWDTKCSLVSDGNYRSSLCSQAYNLKLTPSKLTPSFSLFFLTPSQMFLSYRNRRIDLQSKSIDWFLYDNTSTDNTHFSNMLFPSQGAKMYNNKTNEWSCNPELKLK